MQKSDLSIFIDVAPEMVLERLKRKKSVMENLQTHLRIYEICPKYVASGELKRVDGTKSKIKVLDTLYNGVVCFLKKEHG
jgi:thymidylate kinase